MLGALIAAGASYLGSRSAAKAQEKANKLSLQIARENNALQERIFNVNRADQAFHLSQEAARQREFAQMGIRWRAEDAAAAGFHPLAVLGTQGAMYSPSSYVGGSVNPSMPNIVAETGMADAMAGMGQNLARAFMATRTEEEREAQMLATERARLQNRLLDAQITATYASIMGQPSQPAMPSSTASAAPSVPVAGAVRIEPSVAISHKRGDKSVEAASTPLLKEYNIGGGAKVRLPSQQAAEAAEAMGPLSMPFLLTLSELRRWWHGPDSGPPDPRLHWSPFSQAWVPKPSAPDLSGFSRWRSGRTNPFIYRKERK